jgi:6-phosphogluconolactonase
MTTRTIRMFPDAEAISQAAATEIVRCATEAIAARGRFTLALSGGSTPEHLYQLLAGPPFRSNIDWKRVEVFWGDERCVPPEHRDSNYRMAREAMLQRLPIPPAQVHRIEAERQDRASAARDYQAVIARVFGIDPAGEPATLDLVLLGMGPCGHTASLFPGTAALGETKAWVTVNFVPKFATDRITLTYPILNRAREVLFLVAGTDKADTLAAVLEGPPDPIQLPSQKIQPANGPVFWFVDRLAAARLTRAGEGAAS